MPGYLEFVRDTQSVSRGVIVGEPNWEQTLNENREKISGSDVQHGCAPSVCVL